MCYIQVDAEEDEEEEEDAVDKRQKLQQKWRVVCIMSAADAELQGVARKERASRVQLLVFDNKTYIHQPCKTVKTVNLWSTCQLEGLRGAQLNDRPCILLQQYLSHNLKNIWFS